MRLLVDIETQNKDEINIKYDFINILVSDLKKSMLKDLDILDYTKIEKIILNAEILWKLKQRPTKINSKKVILFIINNITWYEEKDNKFLIMIDKYKKLPNSNTSLETVAKLIDYGSPGILPIRFFANHFQNYRVNSKKYWNTYKQYRTKIKVKRLITIT